MESPIVFVNVAWMKYYQGSSSDDELVPGNFAYLKRNKGNAIGHEQWNFMEHQGFVHAYVPRSCNINITRLGANVSQSELKNVLVVFVARDPIVNVLKVVGWYKNATVKHYDKHIRKVNGTEIETSIRALATDSHIIPVADRKIVIPTAKNEDGGFGQSPVWYAEHHPELIKQVRMLIEGKTVPNSKHVFHKGNGRKNLNSKNRIAVEKQAMDMAMNYFNNAKDVSKECKGWDIEAMAEGSDIYVEVKGLSGALLSIELTPNEYYQMNKQRHRYLLFVVTEALTNKPRARIFRFNNLLETDESMWVSDLGEVLNIQERIGARAAL